MLRRLVPMLLAAAVASAQNPPSRRTLVLSSGGRAGREAFVRLAGGPDAQIVFVPTAASSLRSDAGLIWNPDDSAGAEAFREEMRREFGVRDVVMLHTRDRRVAGSREFLGPLRAARALWFSGGNPGRLAAAYRGTAFQREIAALVARGGVVGGESAGAIIQGSMIVRGRPDKPVLLAKDQLHGFGLLRDAVIDPHLTAQKRENELLTVVDRFPRLLGIGIDDDTAIVVTGDVFEVIGRGRVAIFDNVKHKDGWYYWLNPGARFSLKIRQADR